MALRAAIEKCQIGLLGHNLDQTDLETSIFPRADLNITIGISSITATLPNNPIEFPKAREGTCVGTGESLVGSSMRGRANKGREWNRIE